MNLRKLDKLILRSFIGPLVLTLFVVVFILLVQLMINKMDEFVGKDLGLMVLSELMFYFSINLTQTALPLAVLLSSLMAFGNLGEFSELTAIKGAGISLLRALRPAFILTLVITVLSFFNNNYIVTKANLNAYSLLYDIKKHKPSLDIKEGTFYNGIPEFSIKVNKKYPDGETLGDIIIYNHVGSSGNNIVTFADSGRMYSVLNNRYLMFELYDGKRYEERPKSGVVGEISEFIRNDFSSSKLVLSLASFDFKKSRRDLWTNHYYMKNIHQLKTDVDSMKLGLTDAKLAVFEDAQRFFGRYYRDRIEVPEEYLHRKHYRDSVNKAKQIADSIHYRQSYNQEDIQELTSDSIDMEEQMQLNQESFTDQSNPATQQPSNPATATNVANPKSQTPNPNEPNTQQTGNSAGSPREVALESATRNQPDFSHLQAQQQNRAIPSQAQPQNRVTSAQTPPRNQNAPSQAAPQNRSAAQVSDADNKPANQTVNNTTQFSKVNPMPAQPVRDDIKSMSISEINVDSILAEKRNQAQGLRHALSETRNIKNKLSVQSNQLKNKELMITRYKIEVNKKYAQAFACLVMFLIGAPLGSIIKKGGLGVPVIISIVFFILYYVMTIIGKKWAEEEVLTPFLGIWGYSFILLPVGFWFLRQAKNDARLLESDFYAVWMDKLRTKFLKSRNQPEGA